jgi:hypothetical protein
VFFFFGFLKSYGTLCASAYAMTQLLGFSFHMNMVIKDPKRRHIPMCSMVVTMTMRIDIPTIICVPEYQKLSGDPTTLPPTKLGF